jgi:uncharacterized protein (TIGR03437 family)
MKNATVLCLFYLCGQSGFAQSIRVMNAASFNASDTLSPDMIVSVLGTNLTNSTASAADVQHLPTMLSGVRLMIGGVAASLIYVSPTQVNAIVGASTPAGHDQVVLTSSTGSFSTTVNVNAAAPPGFFSLQGSGAHDGAILNAVSFQGGAFSVNTNGQATFLAIFVTGLNLATAPVVRVGGVPAIVQWFGNAPGFSGLQQINVQLPTSLAGAGRVEVMVTQNNMASNVVEAVILPNSGQSPFPKDPPNTERSRELAAIAWVPGTSLALLTDENDDVVRVIDIQKRAVTKVITLPTGAEPVAVAVNATGMIAVVAERGRNAVAILDLQTFMIKAEAKVGGGPVSVAISGNQAVVVNQESDSISFVDVTTGQKLAADLAVSGRAPRAVAVNATTNVAYVTIQDQGVVLPINIATHAALNPISLGPTARPAGIAMLTSLGLLAVTEPSAGPNGQVILIDPVKGTTAIVNVNPDRSGGASDIAVAGSTVYFANQSGGSVTAVPVSTLAGGGIGLSPSAIKVDLGARAMAVDIKDNILLVTNQGSGTIVLIDLSSNTQIGRIIAVRSDGESDDMSDDHSDRDHAANTPVVTSLGPATAKAGATFLLTVTGSNLGGATGIAFVDPSTLPGNGHGHGNPGRNHGPFGQTDSGISIGSLQVNAAGTTITVSVTIANGHAAGTRVVRVMTPNGESSLNATPGDTLTIQ